ncbi:MAG: hypothetical protein J0H14_07320 [Alphaproteobacteria bacterium]|nr:hypothetical protein [Alphaproteobacteria bacterium]
MTPQVFTCFVIGILGFTSLMTPRAQAIGPDQAKAEQVALATALKDSKITLEDGINASGREGTPISAKFEMEGEHLQFSAYTMRGTDFTEVVVDPASGAIKSAEKITDAEDLKHAMAQKQAMEKATISVLAAAQKAAKGNAGAQLVSIMPELEAGRPVATIVLVRSNDFSTTTESLN